MAFLGMVASRHAGWTLLCIHCDKFGEFSVKDTFRIRSQSLQWRAVTTSPSYISFIQSLEVRVWHLTLAITAAWLMRL